MDKYLEKIESFNGNSYNSESKDFLFKIAGVIGNSSEDTNKMKNISLEFILELFMEIKAMKLYMKKPFLRVESKINILTLIDKVFQKFLKTKMTKRQTHRKAN